MAGACGGNHNISRILPRPFPTYSMALISRNHCSLAFSIVLKSLQYSAPFYEAPIRHESCQTTNLRREHDFTVEQLTHIDDYLTRYLAKEYAKVDEFIEGKYTAAALAGIALHGDSTDAPMVRKFLETSETTATSSDIRLQALK